MEGGTSSLATWVERLTTQLYHAGKNRAILWNWKRSSASGGQVRGGALPPAALFP